jgi:hypothetical protein
LAFVAAD